MLMDITRWTDERKSQIKDLISVGKSYKEISEIMRVTKNAIVGVCHRMGIRAAKSEQAEKPTKISDIPNRPIKHKKFKRLPVEKQQSHKGSPFPPGPGRCLSITGMAKEMRCCGLTALKGSSWCLDHHRLYYSTVNGQRK